MDDLLNHFLSLHEECNVAGCEDVVQEITVHSDQDLRVFEMVAAVPDVYKLFCGMCQVGLGLEHLLNQVKSEWLLVLLFMEKRHQMRVHFVLQFADCQKGSPLSKLFYLATVEKAFLPYALEEKVFVNRRGDSRFGSHRLFSLVFLNE